MIVTLSIGIHDYTADIYSRVALHLSIYRRHHVFSIGILGSGRKRRVKANRGIMVGRNMMRYGGPRHDMASHGMAWRDEPRRTETNRNAAKLGSVSLTRMA